MDKINLGSTIPAYPMPVSLAGTHVNGKPNFLTDGKMDFKKMKPLILSQPDTSYWGLGEPVARAWSIGKKYKAKRNQHG
jgi:hypothetical protein